MGYGQILLLILFHIILSQFAHRTIAQPQYPFANCMNGANYTRDSLYEKNLNTLLISLPSHTSTNYGFYNASAGQDPDKVNAITLCRGDVSVETCGACLSLISIKLREQCPNNKKAIYIDEKCMLMFSDFSILYEVNKVSLEACNILNVTGNMTDFKTELTSFMDQLQRKAATGGSLRKFATETFSSTDLFYVLMQCLPDLSEAQCVECLSAARSKLLDVCNGRVGGLLFQPSCNVRYENYTYYDPISAISLPPAGSPISPPRQPSSQSASPTPQPPPPVEKKHNRLSPLAISGIVGASLLLPLLVLLILWRRGYFNAKDPEIEEIKAELQGKFFSFQQIKAATENFSSDNKLGEGGFGSVFKGILSNGTAIAVKQFSTGSMQGIREFVNEIGTVSALQHPNLVKLLGCCAEDTQRLLVYEYMENNSLHHALFVSEELKKRLDWATRVKICHGIAKGLTFLHEESGLKVVHRDIKPTNILLDKDLTPKISDFGFAKIYEGEASHIITRIAGTTGYMAPEYAMRGHLTYKADVYSFGVVLLEIVSGKNSASYLPDDQSVYLLDLACVLKKEGNLIDLVDPTLEDYVWDEANTILNLALLCTDRSCTLRPTMSEVVKILEGESNISNYSIGDHYSMDDSAMAKVIAGLSQSTHSGSTSHAGKSAISLSAAGNSGISGKETSSS